MADAFTLDHASADENGQLSLFVILMVLKARLICCSLLRVIRKLTQQDRHPALC